VNPRAAAVLIVACRFGGALQPSSLGGSPEHYSDLEITGHIFKPVELPAPEVSQLHVQSGFRLRKFAENLANPQMLTIGPNGNVYITRRQEGDVLMFRVGSNGLAAGQPIRMALDETCVRLDGAESIDDFIAACRKLRFWKRKEAVSF